MLIASYFFLKLKWLVFINANCLQFCIISKRIEWFPMEIEVAIIVYFWELWYLKMLWLNPKCNVSAFNWNCMSTQQTYLYHSVEYIWYIYSLGLNIFFFLCVYKLHKQILWVYLDRWNTNIINRTLCSMQPIGKTWCVSSRNRLSEDETNNWGSADSTPPEAESSPHTHH